MFMSIVDWIRRRKRKRTNGRRKRRSDGIITTKQRSKHLGVAFYYIYFEYFGMKTNIIKRYHTVTSASTAALQLIDAFSSEDT